MMHIREHKKNRYIFVRDQDLFSEFVAFVCYDKEVKQTADRCDEKKMLSRNDSDCSSLQVENSLADRSCSFQ